MGNSDKPTWVVLIKKSPRGPLTFEEVEALLEQGIVKRNDVAYQVLESATQKPSWKFIWQYKEFDRRTRPTPPPQLTIPKSDQRLEAEEKAISEKVIENIPLDLLNIAPEELVGRAISAPKPEADVRESEQRISIQPTRTPAVQSPKLIMVVGILLFLGFFSSFYFGGSSLKTGSATASKESPSNRTPAQAPQVPSVGSGNVPQARRSILPGPSTNSIQRASNVILPKNMALPSVKAPEARDNGEVNYEDYRLKRDQELEREKQEEERRKVMLYEEEKKDKAKGETDEEEETDEEGAGKAKKKAKRQGASDEEGEEDAADTAAETE